ncbi:MAG: AraC family transcriptional regulator [Piscirickettsiaceae bacterium]|nr:AraC family transcriptional regulator [Piscirickettsiaceae bacterium]
MQLSPTTLHKRRSKCQSLIENKVSFQGPDSELSIYDTYRSASRVGLDAEQLLYCGMVSGKKIMHLGYQDDEQGQVFLPHESYVMSPGKHVEIDFPDAKENQPTTCLTIEFPKEKIESISQQMQNLTQLDVLDHDWQYQPHIIHTHHTADTQQLLEKLVTLFTQNHPDKEIMVGLGVSELIIKLLRQQGRELLLNYCQEKPDASGMVAAIHYLNTNLAQQLNIDEVCRHACMSRSKLYIEFKKQLGCTPSEYLQQSRLKLAAKELRLGKKVSEVCYRVGFTNLSHFSRRFTRFFGCPPSQFLSKNNRE